MFSGVRPGGAFTLSRYSWPAGSQIEMHLGLSRPQGALQDGSASWNASAADALAIWNQYLEAVTFIAAAPTGPSSGDGANSVFFSNHIYGEPWPAGTLAVTLNFSHAGIGVFSETEVIFNNTLKWNSYRGPLQGTGSGATFDLHRVALHEFGHVLGLAHPDEHSQSVTALMNSVISDLDHVADDDIAGATFLYGLRLTSAATATGSEGEPFVFQLRASLNDVMFSSPGLPAGLIMDSTGLISGTPAAPGIFVVHFTLSRNGKSVTESMTLNIVRSLRAIDGPTGLSVAGQEQAEPVGPNNFYFTPADGTFSAVGSAENPNGTPFGSLIKFAFSGAGENWRLEFRAPDGVPFTVGRYDGLNGFGGPSMALYRGTGSAGGRGGYLDIKSIAYGTNNQVLAFDATFEMLSGFGSATIRGAARFSSDPSNPPATPVISTPLDLQVVKGVPINYRVMATNNPMRYKAYRLPDGLSFDAATASITGIPASTGHFDIVLAAENSTGTGTARLKLVVSAAPPPHTLQNIATRLFVGTDADVAIAGFILTGNAPKRMIVRAIGPSLSAAGVNGVLRDPSLQLQDSTRNFNDFNDTWLDRWESVRQSGLQPGDKNEAAVVGTISPGHFTSIMRPASFNSVTGVGLIEVYDLDSASGSRFANISTRGRVKTGENVMIGGFILGGDQSTRIVVRGMGPSLTANGVAGALADPVLALYDSQGAIVQNDNWRETHEQQISATGLAPADDREAAVLVVLPPGNYTAILSGKENTAGVGLIEIYNLDAN